MLGCGDSARIAPWGELLSTAARAAAPPAASPTDGVRDIRQITANELPVFHGGIAPLDSKGRGRVMVADRRTDPLRRHPCALPVISSSAMRMG